MLKSYKDLARWYPPLEPEGVATGSRARTAPPVQPAFVDDGAARYPHYIRETEPEPFDIAFVDEPSTRRAEFTGGWVDWVGSHAPGPDDDYPIGDGQVVHFPWEDEEDEEIGERPRRPHVGRDDPAAAASPGRLRARPNRLWIALVLVLAVLLLVAAGGFALYVLHTGSAKRQSLGRPALTMRLSAVTSETAAGSCPTERSADVLRGAEPGGTDSGPAAIMWFQHSYYVERSGERAWQVVAPGAPVPPPALIQRGIDSVPPGTDYCVRVANQSQGKYTVEVTERRPGGAPTTYDKQTVTTAVVDGRTLITSIAAG
ncbi:hypothetical protein [Nocardia sp. NPDC051570]|uniref:hypothetical protein n=1 Tax=Nocardia sp. NPDC051570 TaxID=3364324 RepID=UPI0037ADDAE4